MHKFNQLSSAVVCVCICVCVCVFVCVRLCKGEKERELSVRAGDDNEAKDRGGKERWWRGRESSMGFC